MDSLSGAQGAERERLEALVPNELRRQLGDLRRDLHRFPELSSQEHRTSGRLRAALDELGIDDVREVAGTGLVARVRGSGGGATVALRGDIDGLPITEETGLIWASENPGVMHACGHDVHATWAVGAAALLREQPAAGDVLVVLQPAEETASGALQVLESGALDEAQAIFGGHVDPRFPVGTVVAQAGPVAGSTDEFEMVLRGSGAHGARPHLGVDPIVAAAAVIQAAQTLVARRLAPGEPGVVSFGQIVGGTASNVIPESVTLRGTLRSASPDTRELLRRELVQLSEGVAAAVGVQAETDFHGGTPPIVNSSEAADLAHGVVFDLLGDDASVLLPEANLGGEDFAFYLERMDGCFVRVGSQVPGEVHGAHTPRFQAADEAIWVGSAVLAEIARRAARIVT